jgi:hypothetical protein
MVVATQKLPENFYTVNQGVTIDLPAVFRMLTAEILVLQLLSLAIFVYQVWIYDLD